MLLIHIGGHKTGSTALQHFFAANAARLAAAGIVYPEVGREGAAHHRLARAATPALLAELAATVARPEATVLLSSELFELLDAAAVERIVAAARPRTVRVFGYVRDFRALLPSKYAQRTKTGGNTLDFDRFFTRRHGPGVLRAVASFGAWADVLGWAGVRVRALAPEGLAGGDLYTDALAAIGLPATLATGWPRGDGKANATPPWPAVEAIRAIVLAAQGAGGDGPAFPAGGGGRGALFAPLAAALSAAAAGTEDAVYLTPQQAAALAAEYGAEIDRLNAVVDGPPLPPPAAADPEPRRFLPAIEAVAPELRHRLAAAAATTALVQGLPPAPRAAALAAVAGTGGRP